MVSSSAHLLHVGLSAIPDRCAFLLVQIVRFNIWKAVSFVLAGMELISKTLYASVKVLTPG